MTNRDMRGRFGRIALCAVSFVAAAAGCGGGGGGGTGATGGHGGTGATGATGGSGNTGGGTCPTSTATGTLAIQISGTPSGNGLVVVGPVATGTEVTTSSDLPVAAGPQTVTAYLSAEPGTLVRTAYTPIVDEPNPCVRAGEVTTVHVTYSIIDTSGVVWTGLSNGPSTSTLLGFDPATVTTSGSPLAVVAADTHGADGFTFDAFGNLWLTGGTTADPGVARYPAAMLATDGVKTPDFTLNSDVFSSGIPGPKVVTFDRDGNLWVSVVAADKVVKFTASQLVAGASTVPAVEESGLDAPYGVAFDAAGNMWVASNGGNTVLRIDAAHLTTSGSGADLTITAMTSGVVNAQLRYPMGLAFDATGNLWVNYDGTIAELPTSVLGGTGAITVTPPVQLVTDVLALPEGIAFDEQGGLWFAYSAGKIARFAPAQLVGQGAATPSTIVTSSDIGGGNAGWFAFYPAPAFTPLAHAFH
jgi:sugar lactone lactonase YvrE